jgi:hypothetical protein
MNGTPGEAVSCSNNGAGMLKAVVLVPAGMLRIVVWRRRARSLWSDAGVLKIVVLAPVPPDLILWAVHIKPN